MQVGFGTAIKVVSDTLATGLDPNNIGVTKLLAANAITEKTSRQLAASIRANTVGLGLSREEIGSLAQTTLGLRNTFHLTTTELQKTISALGDRLKEFGALDLGKEASEASMVLGAMLGKGAEQMGANMLAAATDASKVATVHALGIGRRLEESLGGANETAGMIGLAFDAAK